MDVSERDDKKSFEQFPIEPAPRRGLKLEGQRPID